MDDILKHGKILGDQEKELYDGKLKTDTLICRNLLDEAQVSVEEVESITEDLSNLYQKGKGDTRKINTSVLLGRLKKINYNLRSEQEVYINQFVELKGIYYLQELVEECEYNGELDMIAAGCQALA